ncbi:hypothetical protein [Noviherbaspirillum galbum]|uniref:Uncharacterized protein n=1 Tax=Noviherbaspirillum galbum TaxID=2709383 RepID=A0A6B3SXR8_9BURK|nr:hypothetical protein [Noviherbaspirillum galbum]NEX63976.1 hypothetical protein [Noviherbaspirillum galbum]
MKSFGSTLAVAAGIALVAGLAACGGYSSIDLGGSVVGLTTDGLVLANNGTSTVSIPANATSYKFPGAIGNYDAYNVTVQQQPPRLTCAVTGSAGTATGISVTWANVACVQNTYTLGGTVSGLTTDGLVLVNGGTTASVPANSTSFTFNVPVADGAAYGVAVLTQPAGQTCQVSNGTAIMGSANVTSVVVTCS